jgi:hypothetical protein
MGVEIDPIEEGLFVAVFRLVAEVDSLPAELF